MQLSYNDKEYIIDYSYNKEYEIPVKIGRIAQTFGAGISKNENRVYKVFADSILKKEGYVNEPFEL